MKPTYIALLLIVFLSGSCETKEKTDKLNCESTKSATVFYKYYWTYCLDSNFIDISNTLYFDVDQMSMDSEPMQRFAHSEDTLTLRWYLANEPMDEAGVIKTLLKHFNFFLEDKFQSNAHCQPNVEVIKNNSMLYFKASGQCNNTYLSVGYGIDNESLVNLMIFYDSKEENEAAHEVVDQLVQSLKITPVTVNGK